MNPFRISALVALVVGAACGASQPAPAPVAAARPLSLVDEVDAMCACTMSACADQVHKRFAEVEATLDASQHARVLGAGVKACDAKAREGDARARELDDERKMRVMKGEMCACHDPRCIDGVTKKYESFMTYMEATYRGDEQPSESMLAIGQEMMSCMSRATIGDVSGPPGVVECDQYIAVLARYLACDKIPQQAKDAANQSLDQMKRSWAELRDPNASATDRQAVSNTCVDAIDALHESAEAMGCMP